MSRIIKIIIFLFCVFSLSGNSTLSEEQWINYTNTSTISTLVLEENYLWQGSSGGAVRRNINDPLNDVFYYNRGNGLAENPVRAVKVDHLGKKWFATSCSGITVWDGSNSITYDTSNSGLVSNRPHCLAEDVVGHMWITSSQGVNVYDGINWVIYDTTNSGLISNVTYAIAIDDYDRVWISLYDKGINMFDGINWINFNNSNVGLISNLVNTIVIQSSDTIWFGCEGGVSIFDGTYWKEWNSYDTSNSGLASFSVNTIAIDSLGRKWFGGCCGGLSMFDGSNWVVYDTTNSGLPSNQIVSIVVDSSGNLWIATETIERYPSYNLTKFDGTNWFVYDISGNQLTSNGVSDIAIDRFGNKWIGTGKKGLCKFDDENWIIYNTENSGICGDGIGSLTFDTSGNLWILSGGGVSKFDGINWNNYDSSNSELSGHSIMSVAIDKSNVKWFGTMFDGLVRFDDSSWTLYDTTNSPIPYNWVQSVAVDSSNNLWLGTKGVFYQGLSGWVLKFDGTDWTIYNPTNSGLPYNYAIWSLAVDSRDRIWIGVYGAGLAMYDGSNWFTYNTSNSDIASNNVMDIDFDPSGNTWCATEGVAWSDMEGNSWIEGGGVSKFDGVNWITYNTQNSGLASVMVEAVAVDSKGNKWFGTAEAGVSFLGTTTSVVEEPDTPLPRTFALSQNYPNPFNPNTTIPFRVYGSRFIVNSPIHTTLTIYNILGQKVRTLLDREMLPGNHQVIWDGKDDSGKEVASGIYFYQLSSEDYTDTKKMLLLK